MKKFLAALLAVMLVMSASITAFGATTEDVEKVMSSAAAFAFGDTEVFEVKDSKDYYTYLLTAEDYDEDIDTAYLASVKKALDDGQTFDIGTLGIIISNLVLSLEDPEDFEGYNLVEMFEKTPLGEYDNLYTYGYAADIAFLYDLEDIGKALCDAWLAKYTMGVGTDLWGWGSSPDDLAMFILTLSTFEEDYADYIEDALKLLQTYNTENGYDGGYGANADSTALALAAYSAMFEIDLANEAYEELMLFYNSETGGFNADYDPIYATKDALFGLSYYMLVKIFDDIEFPEFPEDGEEEDSQKPTKPVVSPVVDKVEENKTPQTVQQPLWL